MDSVFRYKFDKGVIIELYKQNLLTEEEKNSCLKILEKQYKKGVNSNEQGKGN